jgi:hypothetical protein
VIQRADDNNVCLGRTSDNAIKIASCTGAEDQMFYDREEYADGADQKRTLSVNMTTAPTLRLGCVTEASTANGALLRVNSCLSNTYQELTLEDLPDGSTKVHVASQPGRCVDLNYARTTLGTPAVAGNCDPASRTQRWVVKPMPDTALATPGPTGVVYSFGTGQCLDLSGMGSLGLGGCGATLFQISAYPDGSFQLQETSGGQCLDTATHFTTSGQVPVVRPCDGSTFQRWNSDGTHVVQLQTGLALDAASGQLLLDPLTNTDSESWRVP